eukprot:3027192-Pyramimonas_sp.AAC.1
MFSSSRLGGRNQPCPSTGGLPHAEQLGSLGGTPAAIMLIDPDPECWRVVSGLPRAEQLGSQRGHPRL